MLFADASWGTIIAVAAFFGFISIMLYIVWLTDCKGKDEQSNPEQGFDTALKWLDKMVGNSKVSAEEMERLFDGAAKKFSVSKKELQSRWNRKTSAVTKK